MSCPTAKQLLWRIVTFARDALAPNGCVFCDNSEYSVAICAHCRKLLPLAERGCQRCAVALAAEQPPGVSCAGCQLDPPMFSKAVAALHYAFPVDAALKAFKFDGQLYYAPAFASLLLPLLQSHFVDTDALVPVPLHRWRHAYRGFNQATEICRLLSRAAGVPMDRAVRRIRATASQSGLDAAARRRNLKRAFVVNKPLRCRRPVIIDDVMTTGATCRQISRLLVDAGAESVGVLVVARA
jgi:ComF family protein